MIAAIDDGKELHVVKWTGRVRLHAESLVWCGKTFDAAEGVFQVPDVVFTQGASINVAAPGKPAQKRAACSACRMHAQAAIS